MIHEHFDCPVCGSDSCEDPAHEAAAREQIQPVEDDADTDDSALDDEKYHDDTGNAARLLRLHGDHLRFVHTWARWIVWDAERGCWSEDSKDSLIAEKAKDVGREIKEEAVDLKGTEESKKHFGFGVQSANASRVAGMIKLSRGDRRVWLRGHEVLDADGWKLGVENGVVDLRTGELLPSDPDRLMTKQAPTPYDPEAKCPRFDEAMREWHPDPEVRSYVQRMAGAALVGGQRDHRFLIQFGPGANGKGTFVRALQRALGDYAVEVHLSLLEETRNKEHDTVKADLFRTRLAVAIETAQRVRLAEASVKNLTGGDRIRARRMHQDPWSFDPTHSLWLQTNHLPTISGRDEGIWRRVRVVPWTATFKGRDADPDLDEDLAVESAGILRWLVDGCLQWQRRGLDEPEAVQRATLAYRQKEDVFARFAKDTGLVFERGRKFGAARLQRLVAEWAEAEGLNANWLRQQVGDWLRENDCRSERKIVDEDGKKVKRKRWVGIGDSVDDSREEQGEISYR